MNTYIENQSLLPLSYESTEKNINETVDSLSQNSTTIIVAHRMETIINSSRILFFREGSIFAEGSHTDLIKNNKEYREHINRSF